MNESDSDVLSDPGATPGSSTNERGVMKALLLDTETTGLDPSKGAKCIEVGLCLFDCTIGVPLINYSSLLRADSNDAFYVNRIPVDALKDAAEPDKVWPFVHALAARADVIVAHRASFDRQFVPELGKPWVCSKFDIKWPGKKSGEHLVHLALAYGVGVVNAHRAMADVDMMTRIFMHVHEREQCGLIWLLRQAMRPKQRYVALVSYDNRQLAKDNGFEWNAQTREWIGYLPPEDAASLPFSVRET